MKRWALVLAASWLASAAPALSADPPLPEGSGRPPHARERLRDELRRRAASVASSLPSALPLSSGAPPAPPSGSAAPLQGVLKLDELARKWRERAATREERRAKHRAQLLREVGKNSSQPAVAAELVLHARRVAELARIEFLAQNARTGAERDALLARVARLTEKESSRHRQALKKLLGSVPAPSASGASPAPSPSGVSP